MEPSASFATRIQTSPQITLITLIYPDEKSSIEETRSGPIRAKAILKLV
jgi:hypothetical protein